MKDAPGLGMFRRSGASLYYFSQTTFTLHLCQELNLGQMNHVRAARRTAWSPRMNPRITSGTYTLGIASPRRTLGLWSLHLKIPETSTSDHGQRWISR